MRKALSLVHHTSGPDLGFPNSAKKAQDRSPHSMSEWREYQHSRNTQEVARHGGRKFKASLGYPGSLFQNK